MKENIYTISVMDAFHEESECSLCILEKKQEEQYMNNLLNYTILDVQTRKETNDLGFCRRHFEMMYNKPLKELNRLGLAPLVESYLAGHNERLKKMATRITGILRERTPASGFQKAFPLLNSKPKANVAGTVTELITELKDQGNKCYVCYWKDYQMGRYLEIVFLLWSKESDFRELFQQQKGFCRKHFCQLLEKAMEHLDQDQASTFIPELVAMQVANMERLHQEVSLFTKKMAYNNDELPWGTAKDALIRGIQKIAGYSNLK
ncbi:MAG: DUF6062 family protein [Firmicutes bacterium]|nr:DUF6062 family protein [Bacillota bacterium]